MKYLSILSLLLIAIITLKCSPTTELVSTPQGRQVDPVNIAAYHAPINMQIAWMPYENLQLKQTKDNNWVVVESDSAKTGVIPVIQLVYPNSGDTVWVQMNTKNDLLGRLIKHSLMTQEPIFEPYSDYFEKAKCSNCHPADVKVDFDR
jgi:hypothetical protein